VVCPLGLPYADVDEVPAALDGRSRPTRGNTVPCCYTGDAVVLSLAGFSWSYVDLATPLRGLKIPVSVVRFRPWALILSL
jgi:hypothetical protein